MYNDITGNVVCKDEHVLSNMCSKLDFRYEKLFSDVYSIWSRDNITYTNATIDTIRDYCKSISLICLGSEGRYYHVTDISIIPAYSVLVDDVIDYLTNCDELTLETVREQLFIMTYAEIKGTVHCDFPQKLIDICFEYGISLVKSEVSTNEYYLENTEYTDIESEVLDELKKICYCIDLLLVDENYKYIHVTDKNTEVACNVFMSDIQRFLSVYKVINLDAVQEAIKLNDYNKKGFAHSVTHE